MSLIVHKAASLPDYALPVGAPFALVVSVDSEYEITLKKPAGALRFNVSNSDIVLSATVGKVYHVWHSGGGNWRVISTS